MAHNRRGGLSVGCEEISVPTTVVRGYDFRKTGGHLGNVGLTDVILAYVCPDALYFDVFVFAERASNCRASQRRLRLLQTRDRIISV